MNEELKIIIRAITSEAEKNLADVRSELEKINQTANETKEVDAVLRSVGKGAMAAVAGVVALTTAIVALGKRSVEFQKQQAQLVAGFNSVGLSAEQAGTTFKELFGFLGEADRSIEAANLLAQLTQNEEELAEWTNILMGVYAKFPSSLPVESLAEAVNHTAQLGEVQGTLADALEWVGVSVESFNAALANTNSVAEREALIRQTLTGIYGGAAEAYRTANKALIDYNNSQFAVNQALAQLAQYTTPLLTELNNLAAAILTYLKPAFETIVGVLIVLCQWVLAAIEVIASFFGLATGVSAQSVGNAVGDMASQMKDLTDNTEGANNEFKALKRQMMGFDELNIISNPNTATTPGISGGGGGGGSQFNIPDFTSLNLPDMSDFEQKVDAIREKMEGVAVLVGIAAAALVLWKITDFLTELGAAYSILARAKDSKLFYQQVFANAAAEHIDTVKTAVKGVLGKLMLVAGALITIIGYSDAWANGVDWGNLALTLSGLALIIGGLYVSFGPLAAAIGTVAAGVALLVLGVKDFIKNGPTVENTILIIGGAIAVAVGLATAGLSVVVAAIVAAIAAVVAFTAAILLEEPAIMTVADAQNALTEAKERATEAENSYINAVDAAERAMDRLAAAEEAAGMTGEALYAQVQSGALDYANMTAEQKELYKAYIDNEKKQKDLKKSTEEFNAAKKAETMASYEHQLALAKESGDYDKFKKSVVAAFEAGEISADEARMLIEKSMSEMSDASQQTFMKDLPGDIAKGLDPHKYESTGTKIKKWFKNVWEDIKGFFADAGEWFKGIGTKIGDALGSAFKAVINTILQRIEDNINRPFKMINAAIDILNAVPGVSISKLGLIDIPQLATGGITTGATMAMIGERGREAVLPLENNTQWMDALADRIAARNNTPSKIVLQVGEKELGWASINSINGITKQTGGLQLHLV